MSDSLEAEYRERYPALKKLAERLEEHLSGIVEPYPRVDRVIARAKTVESFLAKAAKTEAGKRKYTDPLAQIQDQVGARLVTFYQTDVEPLRGRVLEFLGAIEDKQVVPDSVREFGYEGHHFILFIPEDVFDDSIDREASPTFFELQIKTLFQHAWGEADHDLAYKPSEPLSPEDRRKVAFTAAQAWGADNIFSELAAKFGLATAQKEE